MKGLEFKNIFGRTAKIKFEGGSGDGVTKVAELPSEGVTGRIYYNTTDKKYYVYNETTSTFAELGGNVNPADVMPTVAQTTSSSQSGGDNIITFTFPNGETTQVVIKNGQQGAQGNSGYTGAVGELEVVNNLEDGGEEKALSAEMGKNLKTQAFVEKGTFAEAYAKANENNVVFPWLMEDEDSEGNPVTKMIWHVGDLKFVDAVGAEIAGDTTGSNIIVTATKNGVMRVYRTIKSDIYDDHDLSHYTASDYKDVPLYIGDNPFTFDDIKIDNNDTLSEENPKREAVVFGNYETDNDPSSFVKDDSVVTDIDFNGLSLYGNGIFKGNTTIETIKRLVLRGEMSNAFQSCSSLVSVEISGGNSGSRLTWNNNTFKECSHLTYLYGAGLYPNNIKLWTNGATPTLVDLRDANFSLANSDVCQGSSSIETFIIGTLDLSVDAASWFSIGGGNVTNLVYMKDTPPTLTSGGVNETWLNGSKVTNIYVPADSVTAYQTAWSGVSSSKIKGYTEVNGKIVFES